MASYSIAEAQDKLGALVDEANAGEPVTLTREGRPVAMLRPVAAPRRKTTPQMFDRLAKLRSKWPPIDDDAVAIVRAMRDDRS